MRTINLHCPREGPNGGLIEVPLDDVLPYQPNDDGTARYGFDCMRCRTTHGNLHASLGIANAMRINGVPTQAAWEAGVQHVLTKLSRQGKPIDEFDIVAFMEVLEERERLLRMLSEEDPSQ